MYESIIVSSSKSVEVFIDPFLPQMIEDAAQFIKFDPNYESISDTEDSTVAGKPDEEMLDVTQVSSDQDFEADDDDGMIEEEDNSFIGDYSDDDDLSWRIRSHACRVFSALLQSRPDQLPLLVNHCLQTFISKISERVSNVRLDVYDIWIRLLRHINAKKCFSLEHRLQSPIMKRKRSQDGIVDDRENSPPTEADIQLVLVANQGKILSRILRGIQELDPQSLPTVLAVLTELVQVSESPHPNELSILIQSMCRISQKYGSTDSMTSLALVNLLKEILSCVSPNSMTDQYTKVQRLLKDVFQHRVPKASHAALLTVSYLIQSLRRLTTSKAFDLTETQNAIIEHVMLPQMSYETRSAGLKALVEILNYCGEDLANQSISETLRVCSDLMESDITLLSALQAIPSLPATSSTVIQTWSESQTLKISAYLNRSDENISAAAFGALQYVIDRSSLIERCSLLC